jgi:hypothetical protein
MALEVKHSSSHERCPFPTSPAISPFLAFAFEDYQQDEKNNSPENDRAHERLFLSDA